MTKTKRNPACLEALPECERIFEFDGTPAKSIGGFNTLLVGKHDQLFLANIEGQTLVLKQGRMPIAEADTTVLKPTSLKLAAEWLERAWLVATDVDRMDSVNITGLNTFARIVAAALPA